MVDAGGVTAAARRLSLTRSAVSQSISSLERSLGVQLFNRVGRRLLLTAEGRTLSRRVRQQQLLLRETLAEISNAEERVRGLIRLGAFVGASTASLARLVSGFTAKHAEARVKLLYGSQIGTAPPRFAIVCNRPGALPESYQRYLINGFRRHWGFTGSPIRLKLRQRSGAR